MPAIRRNRQQQNTSSDGSQLASSQKPENVSDDAYDTSYFPLPSTQFPAGTPIQSHVSRKYYSDLCDEREFLKHLKGIWTKKLDDLKEDRKLLERMKDITEQELGGVQPLFQPELTANEDEDMDTNQDTTVQIQEPVQEPFQFINGKVLIREPEILSTLKELENMHGHTEEESSEEERDEDENEAREALNKMLEEFGDVFN